MLETSLLGALFARDSSNFNMHSDVSLWEYPQTSIMIQGVETVRANCDGCLLIFQDGKQEGLIAKRGFFNERTSRIYKISPIPRISGKWSDSHWIHIRIPESFLCRMHSSERPEVTWSGDCALARGKHLANDYAAYAHQVSYMSNFSETPNPTRSCTAPFE